MNVKKRDRMITHLMNFAAFKGCVPKVESYNSPGGYITSDQLAKITTFEFWKNGHCFTWTIDWDCENEDCFEDSTLRKIKTCLIAWLERIDKKERNMNEEKRAVVLDVLRGFAFDKGQIKNVIFNDPATIVFWNDGSKTVVKTQDGDEFDPEKGLAMAISKKVLGNKGNYYKTFEKWLPKEECDTEFVLNLLPRYSKEQWNDLGKLVAERLTERLKKRTPGEV